MLSLAQASQRERAAVAAFQRLPRELQKTIRDTTRDKVIPLAVRAASTAARTPTMRAIVARGRYAPYKGTPAVAFGGTNAATGTGVPGRVLVRGLEYGSRGRWTSDVQTRSPKGTRYSLRKRTTRQFLPDRSGSPTTVTPAMERIADDVLDLWTGIVEDAAVAALDGKG